MNIILLSTIDFLLNLDILSSLVFFEIIIGSGVTTIFIMGANVSIFPKNQRVSDTNEIPNSCHQEQSLNEDKKSRHQYEN